MKTMPIQVEKATLDNFIKYIESTPHSINSTQKFLELYPFKVEDIFNTHLPTYQIMDIPCSDANCLIALDVYDIGETDRGWIGSN